jgi:RNA polymerase sigma-70 factor (ECF subfamily)
MNLSAEFAESFQKVAEKTIQQAPQCTLNLARSCFRTLLQFPVSEMVIRGCEPQPPKRRIDIRPAGSFIRPRLSKTDLRGEQVEDVQVVAMLVRRCIAGDPVAWEEIVQTYNRRIYNICYRFAGSADDAQDLTQEVFIKMYRTLSSYDHSKGAFVTWVTTITRNLLVDHFRKTKQDRMTDSMDTTASEHEDAQPLSEHIPDPAAPPDTRVRQREVSETVHAALGKLSPELREAVILRDLQDMDYREIATVLKVPEGTVKSRINRGRAELARLLQRTYRQVM